MLCARPIAKQVNKVTMVPILPPTVPIAEAKRSFVEDKNVPLPAETYSTPTVSA